MRKITVSSKGLLKRNTSIEGQSIEKMLEERKHGNMEIEIVGKNIFYTERNEGVVPTTNIRTDKFELAMMANDTKERMIITKGQEAREAKKVEMKKSAETGGAEPTQGNKV